MKGRDRECERLKYYIFVYNLMNNMLHICNLTIAMMEKKKIGFTYPDVA